MFLFSSPQDYWAEKIFSSIFFNANIQINHLKVWEQQGDGKKLSFYWDFTDSWLLSEKGAGK